MSTARATVPAPFRTAHRGAGARYVSRQGVDQTARRAAHIAVAVLVVLGALVVLGLVGREDVRSECVDAMHTDVVSVEHTQTLQMCRDTFGARGF